MVITLITLIALAFLFLIMQKILRKQGFLSRVNYLFRPAKTIVAQQISDLNPRAKKTYLI